MDAFDIFVGKLFSSREKDRDDLRVMAPALDPMAVAARLSRDGARLRSEPKLEEAASRNWYILYREALPA